MVHTKKKLHRLAVGIMGGIVLLFGVIAIPYPGPGWLIVFSGLAILATEFDWAKRLLAFTRSKYDAWTSWLKRQPMWIRASILCLTGLVILVTLWLLNMLFLINNWLNLPFVWIQSPLF